MRHDGKVKANRQGGPGDKTISERGGLAGADKGLSRSATP